MSAKQFSIKSPVPFVKRAMNMASPGLRRLMIVGFLEISAVNFYASIVMPYYSSLGYGSDTAGFFSSVIQVVSAVVAFAAGYLADNLGRKKLYTTGQLMRVAAAALLLVTKSYVGLVAVSVARGLNAIQNPAQNAIFASHTKRENRATLYGLYSTAQQFASIIAPVLAGILADHLGVKSSFGVGLALAILAIVVAIPVKDTSEEACVSSQVAVSSTQGVKADVNKEYGASETKSSADAGESSGPGAKNGGGESMGRRIARMFRENRPTTISALLLATVANGFSNGATNILLPFTIMDRFSSAYSTVSSTLAAGSIGTMVVMLVGGYLADLRGRRGLVLVTGAIFPILMSGLFLVNSLWQLVVILILITMMGNIASPAIQAIYMEAVADRDRATFSGLHSSLNNGAMGLGFCRVGNPLQAQS